MSAHPSLPLPPSHATNCPCAPRAFSHLQLAGVSSLVSAAASLYLSCISLSHLLHGCAVSCLCVPRRPGIACMVCLLQTPTAFCLTYLLPIFLANNCLPLSFLLSWFQAFGIMKERTTVGEGNDNSRTMTIRRGHCGLPVMRATCFVLLLPYVLFISSWTIPGGPSVFLRRG